MASSIFCGRYLYSDARATIQPETNYPFFEKNNFCCGLAAAYVTPGNPVTHISSY